MIDVLCRFNACVERASIDEAFVDLTEEVNSRIKAGFVLTADKLPNTRIAGFEDGIESSDEAVAGGMLQNNAKTKSRGQDRLCHVLCSNSLS